MRAFGLASFYQNIQIFLMSYQVLARKFRPATFKEVVGQQHVLTALSNGLANSRLHHAYLFSGTRGVGKTSIARLFAKGLNCENGPTATPCGECENCKAIDEGRFIDLIEIDAASRTKVEDTRELLDNVQYKPAQGRYKVYLIDEVHMLSRHSFNALLKTLEEPPEYVKFLLATTDPQKLPVTILSRCMQFHLKALPPEQIASHLENILTQENIAFESRAILRLADAAQGSVRDALSLTDQAIALGGGENITFETVKEMLGLLDERQPRAVLMALAEGNGEKLMAALDDIAQDGGDWQRLLDSVLALLHQVALWQALPNANRDVASTSYDENLQKDLAYWGEHIAPQDVQLFYQIILQGRGELTVSAHPRHAAEMILLRALAFHPKFSQAQHLVAVAPVNAETPSAVSVVPRAKPKIVTPPVPQSAPQVAQTQTVVQVPVHNEWHKPKSAQTSVTPLPKTPPKRKAKAAVLDAEHYRWQWQDKALDVVETGTKPSEIKAALNTLISAEMHAYITQKTQQENDWAALIERLPLEAFERGFALQCVLLEKTAEQIRLGVRSHFAGQRGRYEIPLTKALQKQLGNVQVSYEENDDLANPTVLEYQQSLYQTLCHQAQQATESDEKLALILKEFDATIVTETIRPSSGLIVH